MNKENLNIYEPTKVFPPGDIIKEHLQGMHISVRELSHFINTPLSTFKKIISGEEVLTEDIAEKIERIIKIKASYLMKLEKNYRKHLKRINKQKEK